MQAQSDFSLVASPQSRGTRSTLVPPVQESFLAIWRLTGSVYTCALSLSNNRILMAVRNHRAITGVTQMSHSVRCQTQFPVFCSLAITQPFSILPASSSIQDIGVGAMMEGRISVSLHLSLKSNALLISIQDPMGLYPENMHELWCK